MVLHFDIYVVVMREDELNHTWEKLRLVFQFVLVILIHLHAELRSAHCCSGITRNVENIELLLCRYFNGEI